MLRVPSRRGTLPAVEQRADGKGATSDGNLLNLAVVAG